MSNFGSGAWEAIREYRFLVQDPDQLWAMVESADGPTASALGDLLVDAAKTINEIGGDLWTHSMAVEWHGEGGEAFRTWCHQAALATLSLGDYSEKAGKWLGHAADTLHEVKPQLEKLKAHSATARSVLDAHAAKATDAGNHEGGTSDSELSKAKTQYANESAEAGALMMKLAQSYTASTEQINALEAPKFPGLPQQFVPEFRGGDSVAVPTAGGGPVTGTGSYVHKRPDGSRAGNTVSVDQAATPHPQRDLLDVSEPAPRSHVDTTNTAIDSAGTLPPVPSIPASPVAPHAGPSAPDVRPPTATDFPPPVFGSRTTLPPRVPGGNASSRYGGHGPLPTVPEPSTSANPRIPGRGPFAPVGPGVTGGQHTAVRGPVGSTPAKGANGIIGGRPTSPTAGRPAGAIPRGTVVGATPTQQQTPVGRDGAMGRGSTGNTLARSEPRAANRQGETKGLRPPAQSDGIIGGQGKPSRPGGRTGVAARRADAARGAGAGGVLPQGDAPEARGVPSPAPDRGNRPARDDRSRNRENHRAEDENDRPSMPHLPSRPDGPAQREG